MSFWCRAQGLIHDESWSWVAADGRFNFQEGHPRRDVVEVETDHPAASLQTGYLCEGVNRDCLQIETAKILLDVGGTHGCTYLNQQAPRAIARIDDCHGGIRRAAPAWIAQADMSHHFS